MSEDPTPPTGSNPDNNNPGADPGANDWRASLPEEIKAEPSLSMFKDVGSLAKSYVHAQKMRNEKGIVRPGDDAPPESWAEFFNAVGRPESPDKYEFGEIKLPEGQELDKDLEKQFRNIAHEAGLTGKQAASLRDWYFKQTSGKLSQFEADHKAAKEKAENDLREEWGAEFDGKVKAAQKAWKSFVDPAEMPAMVELMDSGLGNNPLLVKLFSRVAAAMGEDKIIGSPQAGHAKTYQQQATELLTHPAYVDVKHPEHKMVVDKAKKMFELAYPDQKG